MINKFNIGFMQGRLLPKESSEYQYHPLNWEDEFKIASKYEIKLIEWIVDKKTFLHNSLMNENGRLKIKLACKKHKIRMRYTYRPRPAVDREFLCI